MEIFLAVAISSRESAGKDREACRRLQRAWGTGEDQLYSVLGGRGAASQRACLGGGGEELTNRFSVGS